LGEALRVEGLSKRFGGVQALSEVSFCVQTGERLAIIGPNGAGKTTLFNLISGQLPVTAGRIYFFGREITNLAVYRRAHLGLARSFQITSLFLNLSVLENTLLTLYGTRPSRYQMLRSIYADRQILAKAREVIEETLLWEKRDWPVKNISYGEQRRLEIGLTLAAGPKLLLLDEPSNGLTSAESAGIVKMINQLGKKMTVLIVAHDMDLVFGVAERIIVLHYGQIISIGRPEEIQADPRVKEIYMGIGEGAESA